MGQEARIPVLSEGDHQALPECDGSKDILVKKIAGLE